LCLYATNMNINATGISHDFTDGLTITNRLTGKPPK
jgi:hypothetical protein